MDLDFKGFLKVPTKKNDVEHHMEDDALVINCLDCGLMPVPGSKECLRCMVDRMSVSGGAVRIILRAGKDLEISGRSGQVIRSISSLKRGSIPVREPERRCRNCNMSKSAVLDRVWESFPDAGFSAARSMIDSEGSDEGCGRCIRSTQRALEQLESDLESIRSGMVGGVRCHPKLHHSRSPT